MKIAAVASLAGVLVVCVNPPGAVADPKASATAEPDANVLLMAATEVVQQRADGRVEGRTPATGVKDFANGAVAASAEFVAGEDAAKAKLVKFRNDLISDGVAFTAARVALTVKSTATADGLTKVTVAEETVLDYRKTQSDEPDNTSGVTERVFTFSSQGGRPVLVDQRPAVEAGGATIVDPPAGDSALLQATEPPDVPVDPAHEPVAAATTRAEFPGETKDLSVLAGYNYQAMVNYAERYAEHPNPSYRDFSRDGGGGDCTNFISQALRAGGWQDKPGWYKDYRYWWYNRLNQTRSWVNAHVWGSFAISSGRTRNLSNVWQIRNADILQVKGRGSGQKTHSAIVHKMVGNMPYLAYHTNNRKNVTLSEFLRAWSGGTFYAYRT